MCFGLTVRITDAYVTFLYQLETTKGPLIIKLLLPVDSEVIPIHNISMSEVSDADKCFTVNGKLYNLLLPNTCYIHSICFHYFIK